jgi:Icc-related predicted phosphoesterase
MLFTADLHYALKQFDWLVAHAKEYDMVVIGGDLLDLSSPLSFDVQIVVIEKYLEKIALETRLAISSGNHDGDTRNSANESVAGWVQDVRAKGVFGDGDNMVFGNLLVTICPWWDGPVSRADLERQIEAAAGTMDKRWIWIHHAPPAESKTCWNGKKSIGDSFLLGWIKRFEPEMVLTGHIHNAPFYSEGAWADKIGKTWVFNPGRQIGAQPVHLVLDFVAMTAEWISAEERSVVSLAVIDR